MVYVLIQSAIGGLAMGIAYAILAGGYTMVWGAMRVINFAHAAFGVLAAYAAFYFLKVCGIDPLLSLMVVIPGFFALGVILQELLMRPLATRARDIASASIVATLGISIILENAMLYSFSPTPRFIVTSYSFKRFDVLGLTIPVSYLIVLGLGIVSLGGLYLFLSRTHIGKGIRAVWQDEDGALLSGINPSSVTRIGYGVALATAGVGGVAMCLIQSFAPSAQLSWMLLVWVMATFGGIGSIKGAVLGAIIIGVILNVGSVFIPRAYMTVVIYAIIIALLLVRPQGLVGVKASLR